MERSGWCCDVLFCLLVLEGCHVFRFRLDGGSMSNQHGTDATAWLSISRARDGAGLGTLKDSLLPVFVFVLG